MWKSCGSSLGMVQIRGPRATGGVLWTRRHVMQFRVEYGTDAIALDKTGGGWSPLHWVPTQDRPRDAFCLSPRLHSSSRRRTIGTFPFTETRLASNRVSNPCWTCGSPIITG